MLEVVFPTAFAEQVLAGPEVGEVGAGLGHGANVTKQERLGHLQSQENPVTPSDAS